MAAPRPRHGVQGRHPSEDSLTSPGAGDAQELVVTSVLDASGRRLAKGTLTVAAGLAITGTATLAMIALVDYGLPSHQATAFNIWWLATTLLSMVFGVFEAYLSRLTVAENAAGRPAGPIVAVLLGRCWMVAAAMGAAVLLAGAWLTPHEFGGYYGLTLLLPVFVFLAATQAVERAAATGRGLFTAIATQLSVDGVLRALISVVLVGAGVATPDRLALATCVAGAGGLIAGGMVCKGWFAWPRLHHPSVYWRPILLLLAGSVTPLLASSGPALWLKAASNVSADTIIAFSAALTISRIPTQFVSAAFSPLLSQLGHAVDVADHTAFVKLRAKSELAAGVLGLAFIVVFAVVGAWALPIYSSTPSGAALHVGTLALLATAGALMFLAVVQQASLTALDRWGWIAGAWTVGLVAMLLTLLLPFSALTRAVLAPVAGIGVATLLMFAARGATQDRLSRLPQAALPRLPETTERT